MKLRVLFFAVFIPFCISAQKSGSILYKETMKIELPATVPKEIRDNMPKERNVNRVLIFNEQESTYKMGEQEDTDDELNMDNPGARMRMRMSRSGFGVNDLTYKNISDGTIADSKDLFGKQFLIKDTIQKHNWKVTGQKKQILSYLAMEATTIINDTVPVTAWFTPQLPVSNGPDTYHGLPGMILELDVDNGKRTIKTTSVELGDVSPESIARPTKGKEVTRDEFNTIMRQKMEEMREQRGNNRGNIRIIQND